MENKHYVYTHRRKDTNEVFYVGKGTGDRAYSFKRKYNPHWTRVFNKYGCEVEIVADNLSKEDAFDLEMLMIEEYGLDNLTNMTKGGEGGWEHLTKEDREKAIKNMAKTKKGKPVAHLRTPEVYEKLKQAMKGRTFSDKHKQAISEAKKGVSPSKSSIEKRKKSMKGRRVGSLTQVTCPYCNKTGMMRIMLRWHFDNCKNKK